MKKAAAIFSVLLLVSGVSFVVPAQAVPEATQNSNTGTIDNSNTYYESIFVDSYLERDGVRISERAETGAQALSVEVGDSAGTSWVYEEVISVRNTLSGEEVDRIDMNFRVDTFLMEDAIFSGSVVSDSGTPLALKLKCELRQDLPRRFDRSVGEFDCGTLGGFLQRHTFYESSLPAAKYGDGSYFTEFTYNLQTLGEMPSGSKKFQSHRFNCTSGICLY